jgi:hypothetical protein
MKDGPRLQSLDLGEKTRNLSLMALATYSIRVLFFYLFTPSSQLLFPAVDQNCTPNIATFQKQ